MTQRAEQFTITLAQLNPAVGDVEGNMAKVRAARSRAAADGADLVVFSELFIAGYPPEDLVLKPAFQAACRTAIETLARETADGGPAVLVGTPWVEEGKRGLENALRAKPEDVREQYERQLKELQEAYGEAMLELRARKKLASLLGKDET